MPALNHFGSDFTGVEISQLGINSEMASLPDSEHSPVIPVARNVDSKNLGKIFIISRFVLACCRYNVVRNELIRSRSGPFTADSHADKSLSLRRSLQRIV